jgi:Fe-S-cluster-containing hydrogenase component 2
MRDIDLTKNPLLDMTSGVVPQGEFKRYSAYPSKKRLAKGPVAVIECIEAIPCNPCETICNRSVIKVGDPITNLPELIDPEGICTGCGQCVVICPGLAIFIVDETISEKEAAITLPYEFLPLPHKGDRIMGISRAGEAICDGYVCSVRNVKSYDRTAVVTIVVPKEYAGEVRFFRRIE